MSHFSVLVVANDETDLHAKLLPFYEYGCSQKMDLLIAPFLEFETTYKKEDFGSVAKKIVANDYVQGKEELRDKYEKYIATEQYVLLFYDWAGGELGKNGDWGYFHNPNDKWDWFSIGGRWSGLLHLKEGCIGSVGQGGLGHPVSADITRADIALAGEVNWKGMLEFHRVQRMKGWDNWASFITQITSVEDFFAMSRDDKKLIWEKLSEQNDTSTDEFHDARWFVFDIEVQTREEHVGTQRALTFAFIDTEGNWSQRGQMGWWACVSDKNPNYDKAFWQFVESLPAEQQVYVVDCHI